MLWGDWRVCTFETLCLPLDKISCTRQFESKLSLRSFAKSLAKRSFFENLPSIVFTTPSVPRGHLFQCPLPLVGDRNPAGGSLTHSQALQCSEPLRYKIGGASKVSPNCAEWDRLGVSGNTSSVSCSSASGSSASTALDLVQRELKYLGL